MNRKNIRGQEEIVGFALIIMLVAVILLIFLGFSLRNSQKEVVESYEAESFVSATLQYTTDCGNNREKHLSIQKMISECIDEKKCLDGRDSCELLALTLRGIIENSWNVKEGSPIKGYKWEILSGNKEVIPSIQDGNSTNNYKGSSQKFSLNRASYEIFFKVYY